MLHADPVESSENVVGVDFGAGFLGGVGKHFPNRTQGPPRLLLPSSPALKMLSGSLSAALWMKTSGGYQPVNFASMCPLEVKRDCRMAGQACSEGVVQLSARAWIR